MAAGHAQYLPWVEILQAAEKWGCPPWEVEKGPALWFKRYQAYAHERNKARE